MKTKTSILSVGACATQCSSRQHRLDQRAHIVGCIMNRMKTKTSVLSVVECAAQYRFYVLTLNSEIQQVSYF